MYKPPLVGIKESAIRARVPQKLIDDSVIHTEDDKYMVYKVLFWIKAVYSNVDNLIVKYLNL